MIGKMFGSIRWTPEVLMVLSLILGAYQSIAIAACQRGDCVEIPAWGNQLAGGGKSCAAYYLDPKCTMPTNSCVQCSAIFCSNQNNNRCCADIEIFTANCAAGTCNLGCPAPVLATDDQQATCTAPQVATASGTTRYKCKPPTSQGVCPP